MNIGRPDEGRLFLCLRGRILKRMRKLYVLRGAPGAGKSTWIEENGLKAYSLSPDEIRTMIGTEGQPDGERRIIRTPDSEKLCWQIVMRLLEQRMKRGELSIVDATASKAKDLNKYKKLAEDYRYRVVAIDFTDVPKEECKRRNAGRIPLKRVPDEAIDLMYGRFEAEKVPSGIDVIKPNDFWKQTEEVDLSSYGKILFIGDIHGCYDTLMSSLKIEDDTAYVFLGDYIDRGPDSCKVLEFLDSIKDRKNVCLLEGNHEAHLWRWGNGQEAKSRQFNEVTLKELQSSGYSEKASRAFCRKLRQCSLIKFRGKVVLASHGGIPEIPENGLRFIPTYELVHGTGNYGDVQEVADAWDSNMPENFYQVFGHRNPSLLPMHISERCYCLEGAVEMGGELRMLELSENGFKEITIPSLEPAPEKKKAPETVAEAVEQLRADRFVKEKKLGDGVSSFNFTREAFFDKNWHSETVLARGLFIDTERNEIRARSYEKFFKINETEDTKLERLGSLDYPLTAYVKENGFLGISSYDPYQDRLFIASKSDTSGPFADLFRKLLAPYEERLLNLYRKLFGQGERLSLVFEAIDPKEDPHIVEYPEPKIVLLDAIYNDLNFRKVPYDMLASFSEEIGCPVKKKAFEVKDYDGLLKAVDLLKNDDAVAKEFGGPIEGFVFEDSSGYMVKAKSRYYDFWKWMRSAAHRIMQTGRMPGGIDGLEADSFCRWLLKKREAGFRTYEINIIELRREYEHDSENR